MKSLDINFSGLAARKRRSRDMTVLLLSLLLIVFIAREGFSLQQSQQAQQSQSSMQEHVRVTATIDPEAQKLAAAMASSLNLPWYELLASLEEVKQQHPDVFLNAVLPDARKKQVVIGGQVKQLDQLLAYIDGLNEQPIFREVLLVNQQSDINTAAMLFTLKLEWDDE